MLYNRYPAYFSRKLVRIRCKFGETAQFLGKIVNRHAIFGKSDRLLGSVDIQRRKNANCVDLRKKSFAVRTLAMGCSPARFYGHILTFGQSQDGAGVVAR